MLLSRYLFEWMLLRPFFAFRNIWLNVNLDAFLFIEIFGWMLVRCFLFVFQMLRIFFMKKIKLKTVLITSISILLCFFKKQTLSPLLWMGFNCPKATEPLQGGSLLFTTKFPEVPGTHLIDLGRMKNWVDLGDTQRFSTRHPCIGNPAP